MENLNDMRCEKQQSIIQIDNERENDERCECCKRLQYSLNVLLYYKCKFL